MRNSVAGDIAEALRRVIQERQENLEIQLVLTITVFYLSESSGLKISPLHKTTDGLPISCLF